MARKRATRASAENKRKYPETLTFRVLFVEDEPVIGGLVQRMLSDIHCEVICASNALEAIRMTREQSFDLILLDIVLSPGDASGIDGVSLCRMLRGDSALVTTAIYMLSAKSKRADVAAATEAGATGYIHKPFQSNQLTDLVASLREPRTS